MKKMIALLCMITCIFGLTACGNTEVSTALKTPSQETAEMLAEEVILPYMEENFMDDAYTNQYIEEYNVHEIEALVGNDLTQLAKQDIYVVGNSMLSGIVSFNDTFGVIGKIESVESVKSEVSSEEIGVVITVVGENGKKADAEFIFANDIFLTLESITLNQEQTTGELVMKAVYDTIMGMGTVFIVLILISFIISAFALIPKIQKKMESKKEAKRAGNNEAVDQTIAQIIEKEELSDDTELVAVIAAAIAASEGATSTDGFVVRSIRKANKSRW